jgi:hypothetical protein
MDVGELSVVRKPPDSSAAFLRTSGTSYILDISA